MIQIFTFPFLCPKGNLEKKSQKNMRILRFQRPNLLRRFHVKPERSDVTVTSSESLMREDTSIQTERIEKWLEMELKYSNKGS